MNSLRLCLLLLCYWINGSESANILMVFSLPSKSHYILGYSLAQGLVDAGHDVTMISAFTDKPPQGKGTFKYVTVSDCTKALNAFRGEKFNYFDIEKSSPFLTVSMMNYFGYACSKNAFDSESVKKLLQSGEKFDVVIAESLFTESLAAFGWFYKAPVILLSPVGEAQWVNDIVGNPNIPSYVPNKFFTFNDMNFWERSLNTLMYIVGAVNSKFFIYPNVNKMLTKYFPDCPPVEELFKNVALVLSNSHESVSIAVPHVPNMIDIGGYHIAKDAGKKKWPADLQNLLDNAKNGAIYFSLGSHVKASKMKPETKQIFIKVLSSLNQTVIWKWDEDQLPGKPDNVKVGKWFPQQDILAHPNVKLFITHGGLLSLTETVYLGVPILAMPVLGDQRNNAMRAESLGIGKQLSFGEMTEEKLSSMIKELIYNPMYSNNVKQRSVLLRDRPLHPLDTAVYWVEYVIRHKGAPHLRVSGADLPLYKYLLLDIIIFWSIVFITPIYFIIKIFKSCCKKNSKKQKVKKS